MSIQPKDTSLAHFWISMVKSVIRIGAGAALIWPQNLFLAGFLLILAEALGILEELF